MQNYDILVDFLMLFLGFSHGAWSERTEEGTEEGTK